MSLTQCTLTGHYNNSTECFSEHFVERVMVHHMLVCNKYSLLTTSSKQSAGFNSSLCMWRLTMVFLSIKCFLPIRILRQNCSSSSSSDMWWWVTCFSWNEDSVRIRIFDEDRCSNLLCSIERLIECCFKSRSLAMTKHQYSSFVASFDISAQWLIYDT